MKEALCSRRKNGNFVEVRGWVAIGLLWEGFMDERRGVLRRREKKSPDAEKEGNVGEDALKKQS